MDDKIRYPPKRLDPASLRSSSLAPLVSRWTHFQSYLAALYAAGLTDIALWVDDLPLQQVGNPKATDAERVAHVAAAAWTTIRLAPMMLMSCRADQEDKRKREKRCEEVNSDADWHSMEVWRNRKAMWDQLKDWDALDEEQKALADRALLAMEKAERTEKKGKKKPSSQ
jgi:hypothetical protein